MITNSEINDVERVQSSDSIFQPVNNSSSESKPTDPRTDLIKKKHKELRPPNVFS